MFNKVFVYAGDPAATAELVSGARTLGSSVFLITYNRELNIGDENYYYPEDASVASVLGSIAALVAEHSPELFLCESSTDSRLVAGYVAASLKTSPLCDAMSLECSDNIVTTTRIVYGGSAIKTETAAVPAVALVPCGVFEAAEASCSGTVHELCETAQSGLELVAINEAEACTLNLAAAKRVLGVGRGLSSADNIPALERLATVLGAEIGCTRPVSEEEHWYTKDRYIGVSGCMLKPNFYMAVGISGQIQHMVGVNQSGVIFAIDKNEHAPIFTQADYGLVGDVTTVLPALIEQLEG